MNDRRDDRAPFRAGRLPGASLLLASLSAWVFFAPAGLTELLQLDRGALAGGELWRLFTAHWTHWSAEHLLWDVVVFFVLGALCELRDRRKMLTTVGISALAISLGVLAFDPDIVLYRGLSGLDAALFVLFLGSTRTGPSARGLVVAGAALGAKVLLEGWGGEALFVSSQPPSVQVVPWAHLVGGMVGVAAALSHRSDYLDGDITPPSPQESGAGLPCRESPPTAPSRTALPMGRCPPIC